MDGGFCSETVELWYNMCHADDQYEWNEMNRALLIAGTGTLGASAYPELVKRFDTPFRHELDAKMDAYFDTRRKD